MAEKTSVAHESEVRLDSDTLTLHKRRRSIAQYAVALLILLIIAWGVRSAVGNERFQWSVVGDYLFNSSIMNGLKLTLVLTVVAMAVGCGLGTVLALMRLSQNPILRTTSWTYAWIMRAIPTLVQLIFWFNLGALYPNISIGWPFGPSLASVDSNTLISAWTAAILGLGLHEAAYMGEIVRSGIQAIDRGQTEAALALGMSRRLAMQRIVLPQALRIIIPPTGNQVIGMLKLTSLVSVIALSDLLYSAQIIYARNFRVIPLLVVVVFWYLVVTSILMIGQHYLERHLARSDRARGRDRLPQAGDAEG